MLQRIRQILREISVPSENIDTFLTSVYFDIFHIMTMHNLRILALKIQTN